MAQNGCHADPEDKVPMFLPHCNFNKLKMLREKANRKKIKENL